MTSPTQPIRVRWYHKIILVVVSVLITMLIVEVAARVFRLLPGQSDAEYRAVSRRVGRLGIPYDEFTTHGFIPGNTEFDVDIQLNKLGFRGDDISKTVPQGARRVLLLGDSYTASWEVDEGQRWSDWLNRWLNTGATDFDLVNLGYPGYGTDREYLLYESYGTKLNADLVLLVMYVENDVYDSGESLWIPAGQLQQNHSFFTLDENGGLVEHDWDYFDPTRPWNHQSFPQSIIGWLNGNSLTYRLVRDTVRNVWAEVAGQDSSSDQKSLENNNQGVDPLHPTSIPPILNIFYTDPTDQWESAWQINEALLASLRDSVVADGGQLIVVIIPPHMIVQNDSWTFNDLFKQSERSWDLWYPQNRMLTLLNDLNIPVINPTQTLIDFRNTTGQDVFYEMDRHLNPRGSCVFGTAIANGLMSEGYVAPDAAYPRDSFLTCEAKK